MDTSSLLFHVSRAGGNGIFVSLNKTIPCQQTVSSTSPETDIYNCSVVDLNFDRFLEHRDS